MLGPMIDTLVICTMTALVIVLTGVWDKKQADTVSFPSAALVAPENIATVAQNAAKEGKTHEVKITVTNGQLQGYTIQANGGEVTEHSIVIEGKDGKESGFTGIIVYEAANKTILKVLDPTSAEIQAKSLAVKGKMLQKGAKLTAWGFKEGLSPIGDWGNWVVTISVFLFALSTMISWSYYGDRCVTYLWGAKYVMWYRAVYIAFVYIGATTALEVVWDFGDLALGLMTVPNLIAVVLLMPKIVELSKDYFKRMEERKS